MTPTYRCQSCGAAWVTDPEGEAGERTGRCLRCDGVLFLDEPTAGHGAEPEASPPVPNGLPDDAEP